LFRPSFWLTDSSLRIQSVDTLNRPVGGVMTMSV